MEIGLSHYQKQEWINAIKKYGKAIMAKSLLSEAQKTELARRAGRK